MAWSIVQNVTGSTGATPALSLGLTVTAPTTNNLVLLAVSVTDETAVPPAGDNAHVSSITQTNVTWQKATNINYAFNGFKGTELWYAVAGSSAGTGATINVADGGSTTCDILANFVEFTGNITASVLDSASSTTTTSTAYVTNSLTTVAGSELIVAVLGGEHPTGGPTKGTAIQTDLSVSGPNAGAQLSASYQLGSIGSYSETWTGTNGVFAGLISAFFGGSATSPPTPGGHIRIWTLINRK